MIFFTAAWIKLVTTEELLKDLGLEELGRVHLDGWCVRLDGWHLHPNGWRTGHFMAQTFFST